MTALSQDGYAPIPVGEPWYFLSSTALGEKGKYHLANPARQAGEVTPLCDNRDRCNMDRAYHNPMLANRCKRCIKFYHSRRDENLYPRTNHAWSKMTATGKYHRVAKHDTDYRLHALCGMTAVRTPMTHHPVPDEMCKICLHHKNENVFDTSPIITIADKITITREELAMPESATLTRLLAERERLSQAIVSRVEAIDREIARLASLPTEPTGDHPTITLDMVFHEGTRVYSYAARKAVGKWNTTGPRSPKAYSWDELINWIDNQHVEGWQGACISAASKVKPL